MEGVASEDAMRRGLDKIDESAELAWLASDYTTRPLLSEPWILDIYTTVKPLYGRQEGVVVSCNPNKRERAVAYHCYMMANLCLRCRLHPLLSVRTSEPILLRRVELCLANRKVRSALVEQVF
jgi:hypothetical protein